MGHASTTRQADKSAYYITRDSIIIPAERGDTLVYSKEDFNSIVDEHPELYSDWIENPDIVYYNGHKADFNSEAGQDIYYVLYAYFLKQKNGVDKYAERRKKLIDIYSSINLLFRGFEYSGTYFVHQGSRIEGYAEYSVYLYKQNENGFSKTYDINRQKTLSIQSLRQLIEDESEINTQAPEAERPAIKKNLHKLVDNIDKAITDNFYLRRAQEFHYGHYEYY